MSSASTNSWKALFLNLTYNKYANKNAKGFSVTTFISNNDGYRLCDILDEPYCIYMMVALVKLNTKNLHSITNLGVIWALPTNKILPVYGRGPYAHPIFISTEIILENICKGYSGNHNEISIKTIWGSCIYCLKLKNINLLVVFSFFFQNYVQKWNNYIHPRLL